MSDDYQAVGGVGWETLGGGWMALVRVFGSKAGGVFFIFREGFKHMQHVTLFFCVYLFGPFLFYTWKTGPTVVFFWGLGKEERIMLTFSFDPFFFLFFFQTY